MRQRLTPDELTDAEISNLGIIPLVERADAQWTLSDDAVFSRYTGPIQAFLDISSVTLRDRIRIVLNYSTTRCADDDAHAILKRVMARLEAVAGPQPSRGR